ncbi:hypothetical protein WQE_28649 [Paraburkholderia hospita]|uniref:Uncharacterized protein n=1 Tax=Paraburkholderia hospita TaxID=169430 RepID=A0ABN0FFT8_9BURK|nr:hypothetical protein WQE_28649 [Paraburkholderia hospita]OUL90863.1 hypothetical protein CA603_16750 [Paraburkholderia hospita]OUL92498.1 hypothetical protein CA602_03110 [Paraburkholderia hospita]
MTGQARDTYLLTSQRRLRSRMLRRFSLSLFRSSQIRIDFALYLRRGLIHLVWAIDAIVQMQYKG